MSPLSVAVRSGVYVTSSEGKEGFTEPTLRMPVPTPLLRCHRQFLVNMAHLQEIRLEDNGQADDFTQRPDGAGKPSCYLKSLKEAIACKDR